MSLQIDTFCKTLQETLDVIAKKFPDDKDIFYTQSQVEMSINVSPRMTVKTFYENVVEYEEKIFMKDESFFLHMVTTDESLKCFDLGEKWNEFDAAQKELIFKNVQKMFKLAKIVLRSM